MDVSKSRIAIALAEGGGAREARFLGEIEASEASVTKLVRRLSAKYGKPTFCYEAGPTGYGLYRLIGEFGHECRVVAPSLIPRKPGDRVKTNRRDALSLACLLRAGELTSVWAPDERHEAMGDLVRARSAAAADLRVKRQQMGAFLLRLGTNLSWQEDLGRRAQEVAGEPGLRPSRAAHRLRRAGGRDG